MVGQARLLNTLQVSTVTQILPVLKIALVSILFGILAKDLLGRRGDE